MSSNSKYCKNIQINLMTLAANVAYAFGNSNGNVSDEWVFDCQGSIGNSRIKRPLTLFAVE
jgi:hypothetical protein